MEYSQIRYVVDHNVATMTLNRPAQLNAYTRTMMFELLDAFDRADADPEVRVIIITGEGRTFCAGFELSGASAFDTSAQPVPVDDDPADAERDIGGRFSLRIFSSLKPVIGAINGPAVGIGATMLLPMDFRIASEDARFGFVFARRGIVPEAASGWFLPRLVGIARALDWTLSGRILSAQTALEGGLISAVRPAAELMDSAHAIAREIVDHVAPVSASLTRQIMWQGLTLDHPMEAHSIDTRLMALRGRSADAREGVGSFLEKRAPVYPDQVPADLPDYCPWRSPRTFRRSAMENIR